MGEPSKETLETHEFGNHWSKEWTTLIVNPRALPEVVLKGIQIIYIILDSLEPRCQQLLNHLTQKRKVRN